MIIWIQRHVNLDLGFQYIQIFFISYLKRFPFIFFINVNSMRSSIFRQNLSGTCRQISIQSDNYATLLMHQSLVIRLEGMKRHRIYELYLVKEVIGYQSNLTTMLHYRILWSVGDPTGIKEIHRIPQWSQSSHI